MLPQFVTSILGAWAGASPATSAHARTILGMIMYPKACHSKVTETFPADEYLIAIPAGTRRSDGRHRSQRSGGLGFAGIEGHTNLSAGTVVEKKQVGLSIA